MAELLSLTRSDCGLLAARYAEHANSQRRMLDALEEACADAAFARLCALRQMEKHFQVDLGMLCHHFEHRNDHNTHPIQRAKHEAVKTPGADGRSTNALEVRVTPKDISYVVNGTVVHTTPKSGMTAKTDGIVGVRINHLLDVHVDGFEVTKG